MQGYINRLFGWGKQPSKETLHDKEMIVPLSGSYEEASQRIAEEIRAQFGSPSQFDVPLYNKRLDLLKYLVENNEANAVAPEINALLGALMEQLEVKVYEPPDEFEYELQGPYEKGGE